MGRALTFPRTEDPSPALANSVGARVWPVIELQWEWLGGLPPLRKAAVIGAGSWGTAVAVLLARGGLDVQLGTRTAGARGGDERDPDQRGVPARGSSFPDSLTVKRAADIELAGIDLVCLAVPSAALPQAVGAIGDRVGQRASVLLLSKGMVAPMAALPSEYVSERIRARAIASLGGPAHAKEAVSGTAALVLGSRDPDLRDQLGSVFDEAGLVCERSEDMIGVEVAGAAKNAAALAGAAAQAQGMNAAGIATAQVWRECVAYARARGAEHETFAGIAGVGDLTATILAEGSRNRRAGELLGQGTPAEQIPGIIGQASEALDSVPLIAEAVRKAGTGSSALDGLAGLIAGRDLARRSGWRASGRPSGRGANRPREDARHEGRGREYACRVSDSEQGSAPQRSRRPSSTAPSSSFIATTCATSTPTPTTASATTTTPRTSPSRPSYRPTGTSSARAESRTGGRCDRGSSASPTTLPPTTTATVPAARSASWRRPSRSPLRTAPSGSSRAERS